MSKRSLVFVASASLWMLLLMACLAFNRVAPTPRGQSEMRTAPQATSEPNVIITETVGTEAAPCGTKSSVIVPSGATVYFCLTVFNRGTVTFTSAKLKQENSLIPLLSGSIAQTLAPSQTLVITTGMVTPTSDSRVLLNLTNLKNDLNNIVTFIGEVNGAQVITQSTSATVNIAKAAASLTKTVGLTPNTCAQTTNLIITPSAKVYYCLTIRNTGNVVLTNQHVSDPQLNISGYSFGSALEPGATYSITNAALPALAYQTAGSNSFVNTATYTATGEFDLKAQATAQATARVGVVALAITQTVGTTAAQCATSPTANVPYNSTIYYCLILNNTGDFPLTQFTVDAPKIGINKQLFAYTLAAGDSLQLTNATVGNYLPSAATAFVVSSVKTPITNTMTVVANTADGRTTESKTATALVRVGDAAIGVTKYIETDPSACLSNTYLLVPVNTQVYYCLRVENRGQVALTSHRIYEPTTGINSQFSYVLEPGAVLTVTNTVLVSTLKASAVLGPFTINASVNNTLYFTSTNTDGYLTAASTTGQVNVPTPTRTTTPISTATLTPTPGPTSTYTPLPTVTPTPLPTAANTGTPSPVAVSLLPTPTSVPDYRVASVTTPISTAAVQQPNSPLPQQPNSPLPQQPISPLPEQPIPPTPNNGVADAAALTAQAATATAFALLATPTPILTAVILPSTQTLSATVVMTTTPLPIALAGPHPMELPTPTPPTGFMSLFIHIVDRAVIAAGWIWFICGSLIFFITAGVLAGLGFRRQEGRRYAIVEQNEPARRSESIPLRPPVEPKVGDEDNWPASLP